MWIRKARGSGGTTLTHRNTRYEWPEDGSVTDVPPEFAADLLSIRGGGYSEAPAPDPEGEFSEVDPGGGDPEPGPRTAAARATMTSARPGKLGDEKPPRTPRRPRGKSVTES